MTFSRAEEGRREYKVTGVQTCAFPISSAWPTRSSLLRERVVWFLRFFFQAEDGIRDYKVTGVQTCALPIFGDVLLEFLDQRGPLLLLGVDGADVTEQIAKGIAAKCVFNPAPLLGVGTAFEIARRRADQTQHLCLDDVDGREVESPVVEHGKDAVRGFEIRRGDDDQRAVVGEELPQRDQVGRR